MSTFLKLVGASRYTHAAIGTVSKGETVGPIDDEELVERLLQKGTLLGTDDDTFLKPFFEKAAAPKGYKAPRMQTAEEAAEETAREAELTRRLAAASLPQAPTGKGPNGAETVVGDDELDVDAEPGEAQDPAYHSEDPADNNGDDGLSDSTKHDSVDTGAEGTTATAKVARQRTAAKK